MSDKIERAAIMVVDDDPSSLKMLSSMLTRQGYAVQSFPRGALALAAAAGNPPDLILLDIDMPEMNGHEVCRHLKADHELQDIPVLFISASDQTTDKVKAFGMGAVDYVTKPFHFDEVYVRVQTHLKMSNLVKELDRRNRELTESYDRLRSLEELRDNLVHMIVHDMRSPLMGIQGLLQFLQKQLRPLVDQDTGEDLDMALAACWKLNDMTGSLLDISRMENGDMPLDRKNCDLSAIVSETIKSPATMIRKCRLVFKPPAEAVTVRCDAEIISRVVANLLSNALRVTAAEGEVRLEVLPQRDAVKVTVTDQGPGIPREYLEKIFDKFGVTETRKSGAHSSGLGLTFCKMAVEAHGGRVGVESEKDRGSVFWFILPVE